MSRNGCCSPPRTDMGSSADRTFPMSPLANCLVLIHIIACVWTSVVKFRGFPNLYNTVTPSQNLHVLINGRLIVRLHIRVLNFKLVILSLGKAPPLVLETVAAIETRRSHDRFLEVAFVQFSVLVVRHPNRACLNIFRERAFCVRDGNDVDEYNNHTVCNIQF